MAEIINIEDIELARDPMHDAFTRISISQK